jgi:uncharacterized protein
LSSRESVRSDGQRGRDDQPSLKAEDYVVAAEKVVRQILEESPRQSAAHQPDHLFRVRDRAISLAGQFEKDEGRKVDLEILALAALLHDIDEPYDDKEGHVMRSVGRASEILVKIGYPQERAEKVMRVIAEHSSETPSQATSDESLVLFDADKLDGVGAIGIARTLVFCGQQGMPPPMAIEWYEEKIAKAAPLLRTKSGRSLAQKQAEFVLAFIQRFKEEQGKFVS